jgi:hypothetical protein
MSERKLVKGYVIESQNKGHFYHRSGSWAKYTSPAEGYVWSPAESAAIAKTTLSHGQQRAELAHPAIYDDQTGVTVLTGKAVPVGTISAPPGETAQVPDQGGTLFDMKTTTSKLGVDNIVGGAMSL